MRIAYDIFLQQEVSADHVIENGDFEPFRYECANCGEEVRLAANMSLYVVPHFRHRSGNNDVECENYLGQNTGLNTYSKKRNLKGDRLSYYFNKNTKMFNFGLRFSDEEIETHENQKTIFELRTSEVESPFFEIEINSANFDSETLKLFPVEKFSYSYYTSTNRGQLNRQYKIYSQKSANPTFYKIIGLDFEYLAKLVRSEVLFVGIKYLMIFQSQYSVPPVISLPKGIDISESFYFETIGRKFIGKVITITEKSEDLEMLLRSWGYSIDIAEAITVLWPPTEIIEECINVRENYLFLYSSFELFAHRNVNIREKNIKRLNHNISLLTIESSVKIYKKNAELIISRKAYDRIEFDHMPNVIEFDSVFKVPASGKFFLFDSCGVNPVFEGQKIFLTKKSIIKQYLSNYQIGAVYPIRPKILSSDQILQDILCHYKKNEIFTRGVFESINLSKTAADYIETCKVSGFVNSAVKLWIMEGKL